MKIKEPFIILGQIENRGNDDGFLTINEVLELKLNADLVVLSACSTGKGKIREAKDKKSRVALRFTKGILFSIVTAKITQSKREVKVRCIKQSWPLFSCWSASYTYPPACLRKHA